MTYTLDVLINDESFMALADEWPDLLAASSQDNIFLTWEWLSSWWQIFGEDYALFLLTVRQAGDNLLMGAAPLLIKQQTAAKFLSYREVTFIGSDLTAADHLDFVVRNEETAVYQVLVEYLWSFKNHWDIINFAGLVQTSPVVELLRGQTAVYWQQTGEIVCPYTPLPDTWASYQANLSKSLRYNLRRYDRKFKERAQNKPLLYQTFSGQSDLIPILQELQHFHQAVQQTKGNLGAFQDIRMINFLNSLNLKFNARGWLRLYWLAVGEQIIAVTLNFYLHDKMVYYMTGYDLDWSQLGPGRQLMAFTLQQAIKEGAVEYDFLRGTEAYKYEWQARNRITVRLKIAATLKGKIFFLLNKWKQKLT